MRTTLRLFVVSLLLFGCASADRPVASSQSNGQRIRSLYDAFGRGDIPTVLASFDPNIVWVEADNINYADRSPYRGPQAVADGIFARIGQDWQDFRVNVEQIIDGGDTVATLGRYTATNKSTGKPLNAQFVHVWWLREGKIVRFQQYTDTAQFARVTGVWR
jgi:ketosteroid isomerase-like protein